MTSDTVIWVENLCKTYGPVKAVDGISFEVRHGEIFSLVGPNGAGKTTTLECLEGLRVPDSGSIRVLGMEPRKSKLQLKARIGIQLQESALQPNLRVWEACDLFSSFYRQSVDWDALLERLGLHNKRDSTVQKLSGGQKQRLYIALALLHDPELVFLDELTTGLDPKARRSIWELVLEIRQRGKTIVLTTHYMEEAAYLSDRVGIIDSGKIVSLDTPAALVSSLEGRLNVSFTIVGGASQFDSESLRSVPGVDDITVEADRVSLRGTGQSLVVGVVQALAASGVFFTDFRSEQPTLEDVYLAKTGKEIRMEREADSNG